MANSKPIFESLTWAFTESARKEYDGLIASGLDADLAFALIDWEVLCGNRTEDEVYQLDEQHALGEAK